MADTLLDLAEEVDFFSRANGLPPEVLEAHVQWLLFGGMRAHWAQLIAERGEPALADKMLAIADLEGYCSAIRALRVELAESEHGSWAYFTVREFEYAAQHVCNGRAWGALPELATSDGRKEMQLEHLDGLFEGRPQSLRDLLSAWREPTVSTAIDEARSAGLRAAIAAKGPDFMEAEVAEDIIAAAEAALAGGADDA